MVKCTLCSKAFKDRRGLHGHLIQSHKAEYAASGNDDSAFCEETAEPGKRPKGLRMLNAGNAQEAAAIAEGYMFFDGNLVYTADEAEEMGWI